MKKYKVGLIGATGMVGQRFALLLNEHPWFDVTVLAASSRSAGMSYKEALGDRWCMEEPAPAKYLDMPVLDAEKDIEKIASQVDFVFCAVNLSKEETKLLEEKYAKAECPVVSNNSAHRMTADVPMVVPELNPEHIEIIHSHRK
ncbi:MAG: aspartate-semialdehyde dehydrogenase, partial [Clostridia bacterium]|nr:aspartate-semialdehyde dehydrogenase [Clostridia bacterium]